MFCFEYDHGSWKNHKLVRRTICDVLTYLEALFTHGKALAQGLHPVWEDGQHLLCVAMGQPLHSLQGCFQPVTQCVSAVKKK